MVDTQSALQAAEPNSGVPRKRIFHFWRCFWLAFLVASLGYAWYSFYAPPNDIVWADNYQVAQQQAVADGRPMVLFFTGKWCSPCRIMKRTVLADEEVAAAVNAKFVAVAIDVDDPESAAIMKQYKVESPPITIVTSATGEVLDYTVGRMDKAEFYQLLEAADTPPTTAG